MIGYLKGSVIGKEEKTVLILVNDIGYSVFLPEKDLLLLTIGSKIEIYTEMIVRENEILLFGFLHFKEKEMFSILNEVSGIGPRSSIAIISSLDIHHLTRAVINEDIDMLMKLPGIGKKTAQRIILDIKEKLIKKEQSMPVEVKNEKITVLFQTLEALGYSNKEILNILPEIEKNQEFSEQLMIKNALKMLSGK